MINLIKKKIKQFFIEKGTIPNQIKSLQNLKRLGFRPDVIFDVGAYKGEFAKACLEIWPSSKVVCFEAQADKVERLKRFSASEIRVSVVGGLVGNENKDQVKFHESETASSILEEHISKDFNENFHKMRTLDSAVEEFNLAIPGFLKIDTQGFEYQVIEGFSNKIDKVDVVLAELNLLDIHKGVKLASDVIHLLSKKGFVPFDICELHRRPLDQVLWQVDFLFSSLAG